MGMVKWWPQQLNRGGRLIEMKTIEKLSWGWPKGGISLIEVAA